MNRTTGTDRTQSSTLLDEVPWSDSLTSYDRQHFKIYLRILDACADNATIEEMADLILGIDPALEPGRARKAIHSHIDRANWMITTGYKELFRADEKGKAFAS
ncbi:DUF2285 domain-containing protein [Mesorhizobium sp.]|uniref:DNA -binding domain-containing protein n=1 Tax=Mesorhizobium sp. TaxID=1871066 RepID=UPI000FE68AD7|nr:DUF2285 domain-containing protein [Mesorhizobium sp.]RWK40698.1 MAG: DUF2285 domain-containing protein [Mesorhizobium sp.]